MCSSSGLEWALAPQVPSGLERRTKSSGPRGEIPCSYLRAVESELPQDKETASAMPSACQIVPLGPIEGPLTDTSWRGVPGQSSDPDLTLDIGSSDSIQAANTAGRRIVLDGQLASPPHAEPAALDVEHLAALESGRLLPNSGRYRSVVAAGCGHCPRADLRRTEQAPSRLVRSRSRRRLAATRSSTAGELASVERLRTDGGVRRRFISCEPLGESLWQPRRTR